MAIPTPVHHVPERTPYKEVHVHVTNSICLVQQDTTSLPNVIKYLLCKRDNVHYFNTKNRVQYNNITYNTQVHNKTNHSTYTSVHSLNGIFRVFFPLVLTKSEPFWFSCVSLFWHEHCVCVWGGGGGRNGGVTCKPFTKKILVNTLKIIKNNNYDQLEEWTSIIISCV